MHPKVSVIIPVYNVELYLHECMNSIVNQTLKEIEIICVDDGSTDNSLAILNEYAQKDDRIIILKQENQGAGVARNAGLDIAKGDYLSFLDPDDFFELNMFEELYCKATTTNVDIVVFGCNTYNENTKSFDLKVGGITNGIRNENLPNIEIFNCYDMPNNVFNTFCNAAWNKIYKKEFVLKNKIKFLPLYRNNDVYFTFVSLVMAEKITTHTNILLYYRCGMKTNSQSTLDMYPFTLYTSSIAIRDRLKETKQFEILKESCYISLFCNFISHLNRLKSYRCFKMIYEHIVENLDNDFDILGLESAFFSQNNYIISLYEDYKLMLKISVDEYLELKGKYFVDENDTNLKISVVIPVYNVEKYLRECLDSVVNQTLENIEIICINDGSSDNSINILREYASKDNRIIVLNQINQGQSVARNKALKIAKGKYVYFLDSDDIIVPYALERMFEEAVTNNLDILYFDGMSFFESSELEEKYAGYKSAYKSNFNTNETITGAELFVKMHNSHSYRVSPCLFFIKSDFLKKENILFKEGIIYEDNIFMFKTILVANRVKHIKEHLFFRRVRNNSTVTQTFTFNHFYGYLICYIELLSYSNDIKYNEQVEFAIRITLNNIFNSTIYRYEKLLPIHKENMNNLTIIEKYYFDTFFLPKIQLKVNDDKTYLLVDNRELQNNKYDKINGQLLWARETLATVRAERLEFKKELSRANGIKDTVSYKLGRMITWLPRIIRGVFKK